MKSDQQQAPTATVTTPTDREIHVERVFDAPRERVFATFTDPKLIPEWWGPTTIVDQMDVRPGGSWRFVGHNADGSETAFGGTYREVIPPERIVQTFESGWTPGRVHVETFTFEDLGDRTKLTMTMLFDTSEERDGVLGYGVELGMNETYARLDELLARLASRRQALARATPGSKPVSPSPAPRGDSWHAVKPPRQARGHWFAPSTAHFGMTKSPANREGRVRERALRGGQFASP